MVKAAGSGPVVTWSLSSTVTLGAGWVAAVVTPGT
jgi:hypothetical protein